MLDSLKPFAGLMTVGVIGVLLVIFRAEIHKLVDWLVRFKRVAKTREGYSLEGASEPEKTPVPPSQAASELVVERHEAVPPQAGAEAADTWYEAFLGKRYDAAISLLEAEAAAATNIEAKLTNMGLIGHIKFEQDPTTGIAYFERLIEDHPTKYEPYEWWALTYKWKHLPEKCLAVIQRGLEVVQEKAELLHTKSDCLLEIGRLEDAIGAALQGVEANRTYSANYVNLAKAYLKKGEKDTARSWYLRALDVSEGREGILVEFAEFLLGNGYMAEAILRYQDLVKQWPENPTHRALLGNAFLMADLNSRALETYQAASKLAEDKQGWILANIGNVLNNRGFYAEAIKYLQRALELDQGSRYALERLARAQQLEADEGEKLESLVAQARHGLTKTETLSQPPAV